jgi:anti-sigma regulatory factor (Ser/Thr protein kinase)
MPYLECPSCRLSLYSAGSHSWIADACPVCGESLAGASKRFPTNGGAHTVCREFPSTPGAVSHARHAFDGVGAALGDPLHMTVVLLVSELVTNSVTHSKVTGGVIELLASISPEMVRVEVSDDGEGFDLPPAAHHDDVSGRGLHLVQELADRWGRPTGLRTSVWFEIDRTAQPAARTARPTALRPALIPALRPVAT